MIESEECCRLLQRNAALEERNTALQQQFRGSQEQLNAAKEMLQASEKVLHCVSLLPLHLISCSPMCGINLFHCPFCSKHVTCNAAGLP